MFGKGLTIAVIIATQEAMESWRLFFKYLFKGIGNTELTIDNDWMTVAHAHPLGLDNIFMATSRNRTEIVLINDKILRGNLL